MNIFLTAALSILQSAGKQEFIKGIQKWYDKDPQAVKRVVQTVYPVIDVEAEKYAATTKTKVDDTIVRDLKEVCEAVAEANEFELSNLDEGGKLD